MLVIFSYLQKLQFVFHFHVTGLLQYSSVVAIDVYINCLL